MCDRHIVNSADANGDDYMVHVFTQCAHMSNVRLTLADMAILSKWLVAHTPTAAANRCARILLAVVVSVRERDEHK
jgi:hypothetical protein